MSEILCGLLSFGGPGVYKKHWQNFMCLILILKTPWTVVQCPLWLLSIPPCYQEYSNLEMGNSRGKWQAVIMSALRAALVAPVNSQEQHRGCREWPLQAVTAGRTRRRNYLIIFLSNTNSTCAGVWEFPGAQLSFGIRQWREHVQTALQCCQCSDSLQGGVLFHSFAQRVPGQSGEVGLYQDAYNLGLKLDCHLYMVLLRRSLKEGIVCCEVAGLRQKLQKK